jgi:hypothetical protein
MLLQTSAVTSLSILESGENYLSGDLLVYNEKNGSGFHSEFTVDTETGAVRLTIFGSNYPVNDFLEFNFFSTDLCIYIPLRMAQDLCKIPLSKPTTNLRPYSR